MGKTRWLGRHRYHDGIALVIAHGRRVKQANQPRTRAIAIHEHVTLTGCSIEKQQHNKNTCDILEQRDIERFVLKSCDSECLSCSPSLKEAKASESPPDEDAEKAMNMI